MNETTYTPGKYQAEVIGQGFLASSVKGAPGFYLQLRVLQRYGPAGELESCPQYERTYEQYLANETGVAILLGDLRSLGVEVADLAQLDPDNPRAVRLVGRRIDVECTTSGWSRPTRTRATWTP